MSNGKVTVKTKFELKDKKDLIYEYVQPFNKLLFGRTIEEIKEIYYRDVFINIAGFNGFMDVNFYIPREQIIRVDCLGICFENVLFIDNVAVERRVV